MPDRKKLRFRYAKWLDKTIHKSNIIFAALTVLWSVSFKFQALPNQPQIPFPDYYGYRALADSLQGINPNSHIEFLLPHGYAYFLILVDWIFGSPELSTIGAAVSFAAIIIPITIYFLFRPTCGSFFAFILSFSYLAASETLRYEATIGTDTLATILLAILLLSCGYTKTRSTRTVYLRWFIISLLAFLLTAIKTQFVFVFVPIFAAYLGAKLLTGNRSDGENSASNKSYVLQFLAVGSLPAILLFIMFAGNVARESFKGLSPLGPFNALNYTSKYFDTLKTTSETEANFKNEVLTTIQQDGRICTLCSGRDEKIISTLGITRGEFYTLLSQANGDLLRENWRDYTRAVTNNFLLMFCSTLDPSDDSYAHGYLVRFVKNSPIWSVPASALSVLESRDRPLRHVTMGTILFVLITVLYRRDFAALHTNCLCFLIVLYSVAVVVVSQNAEMFRYRAPIQWLWIAYLWWTLVMIFRYFASLLPWKTFRQRF